MNKKIVGFIIPYYKNSEECEIAFKQLMNKIDEQLTDDMLLYIYEDGQASQWLLEYKNRPNIIIKGSLENKGVSYARNKMLDYLIDKVEYVSFIDSDDMIDDNYLKSVYEYCADKTHEIIEPTYFYHNPRLRIQKQDFQRDNVRSGIGGETLQTKIIENIRFDEKLQIGEDTKFMNEVCDLTKYRKKHCKPAEYHYQMGINSNSLTMKYKRKEIGGKR